MTDWHSSTYNLSYYAIITCLTTRTKTLLLFGGIFLNSICTFPPVLLPWPKASKPFAPLLRNFQLFLLDLKPSWSTMRGSKQLYLDPGRCPWWSGATPSRILGTQPASSVRSTPRKNFVQRTEVRFPLLAPADMLLLLFLSPPSTQSPSSPLDTASPSAAWRCTPISAHALSVSAETKGVGRHVVRSHHRLLLDEEEKELAMRPVLPWDVPTGGRCA